MKPSRVATRSRIRGTSRGVTVVTNTSGAFGVTWAGLREQPDPTDTHSSAAPIRLIGFMRSFTGPLINPSQQNYNKVQSNREPSVNSIFTIFPEVTEPY